MSARVDHKIHQYEHDPNHTSFGLEAAEKLCVGVERVFKTLVVSDGAALFVGVVPVNKQLDLKAMATALAAKVVRMADVADAERASGYVTGAISPLGQKRRLRTVIDSSATDQSTVFVSAGRRGLEIELAPSDLLGLTGAISASIAR